MYSVKQDLPVQRMVRPSQAERLHSLCLIWRCADDQSLTVNEIDIFCDSREVERTLMSSVSSCSHFLVRGNNSSIPTGLRVYTRV